jgi:hypothetical protein
MLVARGICNIFEESGVSEEELGEDSCVVWISSRY